MSNDVSETYLYSQLIDSMKKAEACCRAIAHARRDIRWVRAAAMIGQIQDNLRKAALSNTHANLIILGKDVDQHRMGRLHSEKGG